MSSPYGEEETRRISEFPQAIYGDFDNFPDSSSGVEGLPIDQHMSSIAPWV